MAVTGTAVPIVRSLAEDLAERTADWPAPRQLALVEALVHGDEPTLEGRQLGYELLAKRPDLLVRLNDRELEALGRGNDNWASVDAYACTLAGPAWLRGQIDDAMVARWARSRDRWWRRTALVSTVALNRRSRGGRGDAERTLAVCRVLVVDRDDMVIKGMSWALRALVNVDRQAVERFLRDYRGELAARVRREVRNKLATGSKNPAR
jgi:3-methyladenine DNA glycosylase AlkD